MDNTVLETFEPIPYVDDELIPPPPSSILPDLIQSSSSSSAVTTTTATTNSSLVIPQKATRMVKDTGLVEAVNTVVINREVVRRGKLDKSYSSPPYDSYNDPGKL